MFLFLILLISGWVVAASLMAEKTNVGMVKLVFILALKVILLDRLQGIICSGIQEPYLLGVML